MARRAIVALALAGMVALAGCASAAGDDGPAPRAAPASNTNEVALRDIEFTPAVIEVPAGTTVTWRFDDGSVPHDVSGDGFSSPVQAKGTFTHRFERPGTYGYRCTLHDKMRGQVIVK
jgi:plastocyanin